MRNRTLWPPLMAVIVVTGLSIAPLSIDTHGERLALASFQREGHEGGDGDHDRGHGNDEDGHDEDNPGRGNNLDEPSVIAGGGYTVEVDCDFDDDDNLTECEISADEAWDAPDIGRVTVPELAVCAEVIDGDYVYLGPDSGADVTGYASEEGDDELELELRGRVTISGTQTYWISTIDGVVPAEGPALQCDQGAAATIPVEATSTATIAPTITTVSPSPTPTAMQPPSSPVPTNGSLAVVTYTCADVPEDRAGFDWFGMCGRGSGTMSYSITPPDGTARETVTQDSDAGEVTFEQIEPGTYQLDAVDASWCHATSDNVTAESELVVKTGKTTTVWIFMCNENNQEGVTAQTPPVTSWFGNIGNRYTPCPLDHVSRSACQSAVLNVVAGTPRVIALRSSSTVNCRTSQSENASTAIVSATIWPSR